MRTLFLIPFALLMIVAQEPLSVSITSPQPGDVINGQVTINGTTDLIGFSFYDLEFSYASNPADTWFAIGTSDQPQADSALGTWDTTAITDGDYVLRLRVYAGDGTYQEVLVAVKVQNDRPIVTATPARTASSPAAGQLPTPFLVASSPTPTLTPPPTPTPLPQNSAALTRTDVLSSMGRGALVILGLFIFSVLAVRLRKY